MTSTKTKRLSVEQLRDALDVEESEPHMANFKQPVYFDMVCQLANEKGLEVAMKKIEIDQFSKLTVKVTEADRELAIREDASKSGEKTTENIIAARVNTNPAVIEVRKELFKKEQELAEMNKELYDILSLKESYEHRLAAINNCTKLTNSAWFQWKSA